MAGGGGARQQMINLMYLVLTAMLALNVSAEVLDAFKTVRDGLDESTINLSVAVDNTMKAFDASMKKDPEKTKPAYDKAQLALKYGGDLSDYIGKLKQRMISEAGDIDTVGTKDIRNLDDLDVSSRVLLNAIESEGVINEGDTLQVRIQETKAKLVALINPNDRDHINISLDAQNGLDKEGNPRTWAVGNFQNVPVTAAVTILSKLEGDVKNAEISVLKYLQSTIYANEIVFDQLSAVVVAPSSYVLVGQPYTAEVFLTASSKSAKASVYVGGSKLPTDAAGKGKYSMTPSKVGEQSWGGKIEMTKPDGSVQTFPFSAKFEAGAPSATISADKMNVLYIGVENPITVAASGIPSDKVTASLSGGGTLKKVAGGKYVAEVTTPGKATINVSAEVNGKSMNMGAMEYRVKAVPPPTPQFAGLTAGRVGSAAAKAQPGIFAILENFDFDMRFTVTGYTMYIIKKKVDPIIDNVSGAALTPKLRTALATVSGGDKITVEDITVKDPRGNTRKLSTGISLTVQ